MSKLYCQGCGTNRAKFSSLSSYTRIKNAKGKYHTCMKEVKYNSISVNMVEQPVQVLQVYWDELNKIVKGKYKSPAM